MAFYQQEPFNNPTIPFTGSIQQGLQEGKSIIVSGRVLPGANRFHVNLQCGSRSGADVALHFNPRYDSGPGYIITNTFQNSSWGREERINKALLPIGSTFTLMILITRQSYKISVNGNHIMDYKHRIPFSKVDTIVVDGMVAANSINFQNPVTSCPQPGFQPQSAFPAGCSVPAFSAPASSVPSFSAPASLNVPYKSIINGGLRPGKNITVQGLVNPQAYGFTIALRHRDGIAFLYNPRFTENVVVRNTLTSGQWGNEERYGGMMFRQGQNIQVVISCNPQHYNVFLNGQQVHTFNHRFSKLVEIDVLEVTGDLSLSSVDITPNY
ncbi:galectin-9-like [Trichomycterus rosablanca]|uniref:galectin-9-like n=1 Tax=Trichomycterus rosablanca TaxID=2290929 RepID=UPI002F351A6C